MFLTSESPIIVKHQFSISREKLWEVITTSNHMKQWFFKNIKTFKPVVGFQTQFNVKTEQHNFIHKWKILEVIPFKKIVFDWSYKYYEGRGLVIFEFLDFQKNHTPLQLTNIVIEDFTANIKEFTREAALGGWNYFIKQQLPKYLKEIS